MRQADGKPIVFIASFPWRSRMPFQIMEADTQILVWYRPESNEVLVHAVI